MLFYDSINLITKLGYVYGNNDYYSILMLAGGMKYTKKSGLNILMPFESWTGTALFLLRFSDWWQNNSVLTEVNTVDYYVPDPPKENYESLYSKGKCGLCKNKWDEPVSTPTGFIYCKNCLNAYRKNNDEKCPITDRIIKEEEITSIYLEK